MTEQQMAQQMIATLATIQAKASNPLAVLVQQDLPRRKAGAKVIAPAVRRSFSLTGSVGANLGDGILDDIMGGDGEATLSIFSNADEGSAAYEGYTLVGIFVTCDVNYFDSAGNCPDGFCEILARRILSYLELEVYADSDERESVFHSSKLALFSGEMFRTPTVEWDDEDAHMLIRRNANQTGVNVTAPGPSGGTFACEGELTIYGVFLASEYADGLPIAA